MPSSRKMMNCFCAVLPLALLLSACSPGTADLGSQQPKQTDQAVRQPMDEVLSEVSQHVKVDAQYAAPYGSLSEVLNETDLVLTARIVEGESFDGTTMRYQLDVTKMLYGVLDPDTPAYLYTAEGLVSPGEEYLLFLQADSVPLYPHLVLALTHEELVYPVDEVKSLRLKDWKLADSVDSLAEELTSAHGHSDIHGYNKLDQYTSLADAVEASEQVILVEVTSSTPVNQYASLTHLSAKYRWTSDGTGEAANDSLLMSLPPDLAAGQHCYLLLRATETGYPDLADTPFSVIPADTPQAEELLNLLNG